MSTYVKRWGNSLAVRIPKRLSSALKLKEGSPLSFEESGGKIIIKPARDRKQELADSFKRAAKDREMGRLAEAGLTDYLKQLKNLD